jgi:hypothetical protein
LLERGEIAFDTDGLSFRGGVSGDCVSSDDAGVWLESPVVCSKESVSGVRHDNVCVLAEISDGGVLEGLEVIFYDLER